MPEDERREDQYINLQQQESHPDHTQPPEARPNDPPASQTGSSSKENQPRGIAPIWHTLLLVLGILGYSLWGAMRPDTPTVNPLAPIQHNASAAISATISNRPDPIRLIHYGLSAALELAVVAWVMLGLRLRKIPFRSLFDAWPKGLNNITKEAGIAALFWICSMAVLGSVAISWQLLQTRIYEHPAANHSGSSSKSNPAKKSPQQQQVEMARKLMELAPANGIEIAAWGILCLIVGFSEEVIFRGYLQAQSIALLRRVPFAVLLTAVIFGAAHGYQGVRGIVLISVYGALFSGIALLRKNLFPGMLAHSWHDFATGMALAMIRSLHLLDHLPPSR
jgi:membrane protease YdiL (CAAX protease family)